MKQANDTRHEVIRSQNARLRHTGLDPPALLEEFGRAIHGRFDRPQAGSLASSVIPIRPARFMREVVQRPGQ